MDWLTGPRILVRDIPGKTPHRILACYIEDIYCNYKTILNINPSENTTLSMKYLLGLLNSSLLSFIYPYISNKLVAETFPRLSVKDLRLLPIRNIDFTNKHDLSLYDSLIYHVDRMQSLFKKSSTFPLGKETLRREIAATDKQIDNLVYQLAGLTPEEIKIVEGV